MFKFNIQLFWHCQVLLFKLHFLICWLNIPSTCYHLHFIGEETEMQIGFINCQRPHPYQVVKQALNPTAKFIHNLNYCDVSEDQLSWMA